MIPINPRQPHYYEPFKHHNFNQLCECLENLNRDNLIDYSKGKNDLSANFRLKAQLLKQIQLMLCKTPGCYDIIIQNIMGIELDSQKPTQRQPLIKLFTQAHLLDLNETVTVSLINGIRSPSTQNAELIKQLTADIEAASKLPHHLQKTAVINIRNNASAITLEESPHLTKGKEYLISLLTKCEKNSFFKSTKLKIRNLINAIEPFSATALQLALWTTMGEAFANMEHRCFTSIRNMLNKYFGTPTMPVPVSKESLDRHTKEIIEALWLIEQRHDSLDSLLKAEQGDSSFTASRSTHIAEEDDDDEFYLVEKSDAVPPHVPTVPK